MTLQPNMNAILFTTNRCTQMLIACCALFLAATSVVAKPKDVNLVFSIEIFGHADEHGNETKISLEGRKQIQKAIEARLKAIGHSNATIKIMEENVLHVMIKSLPEDRTSDIHQLLESSGMLELRKVNPNSDEKDDNGKTAAQRVMDGDEIVPGYKPYNMETEDQV
jgi:hypothetical protein